MLTARPRFAFALAAGLVVGVGCHLAALGLRPLSCAIAGWNAFCLLNIGLGLQAVGHKGPEAIRARAAREDQGSAVILLVIVGVCVASLAAVAGQLSAAAGDPAGSWSKGLHLAVAFSTVAASWFLMQMVFAVHYAHEYYAFDPKTDGDHGGLAFPGEEAPDYWDFLHFAIVIGVAAQTADVSFTRRRLRRLGTAHSVVAFVFNTGILALTINLAAGLFPKG